MNFASYFVIGMLGAAGWPRKGGFLGRKLIADAQLIDTSVNVMSRSGVALGAEAPYEALRLLTHLFSARDWERDDTNGLVEMLTRAMRGAKPDAIPWKEVAPSPMATAATLKVQPVPWETLFDPRVGILHAATLGQALAWGLADPLSARAALERDRTKNLELLPEMQRAGLDVQQEGIDQSPQEIAANFADLMTGFEAEFGVIPPPARQLAAHPMFASRF